LKIAFHKQESTSLWNYSRRDNHQVKSKSTKS